MQSLQSHVHLLDALPVPPAEQQLAKLRPCIDFHVHAAAARADVMVGNVYPLHLINPRYDWISSSSPGAETSRRSSFILSRSWNNHVAAVNQAALLVKRQFIDLPLHSIERHTPSHEVRCFSVWTTCYLKRWHHG